MELETENSNALACPVDTLVMCSLDGIIDEDYCIIINHPSGKIIKILIPVDGGSIFEGEPYGLNMVSNGHYT